MTCPYAESLIGRDDLVKCRLISDVVGWVHVVHIGICEECQCQGHKMTGESRIVAESIIQLLKNRIVLHWDWDDMPERRVRLRDDIEGSVRILRNRAGTDVAADALVQAVRRGMPRKRARGIAQRVLPEQTRGEK